jgi:elongation factor Tu
MLRTLRFIVSFATVLTVAAMPPAIDATSQSSSSPGLPKPATKVFDRSLPHLNVLVVGETAAARKALVSAITRVLATRHPPSRGPGGAPINTNPQSRRSAASVVEFSTARRSIALVDVGSSRSWRLEAITGALSADAGILVVSGVKGVSEETLELVRIARRYGIAHLAVFIVLDPLTAESEAASRERGVRELLTSSGFERDVSPIIRGAAANAANLDTNWVDSIEELLAFVDVHVPLPRREIDRPFLMPIDQIFAIPGRGTVVTGRVERGRLRVGGTVDIVGSRSKHGVTVAGVEMFRKPLTEAVAGDNVGLLLQSVSAQDLERGQVVAAPNSIKYARKFQADVYLLSKQEGGLEQTMSVGDDCSLYVWTATFTCSISRIDGADSATPGSVTRMEIALSREIALEHGARFQFRHQGRMSGAGLVTGVFSLLPD